MATLPRLPKIAKPGTITRALVSKPSRPSPGNIGRSTMRGRFIPKNPSKYLGDPGKIMGRSSWEFRFFMWCDRTPAVLQWASEEFSIPYLWQAPGEPVAKVRQYYPDALVVYRDTNDVVRKEIIEIKPMKETKLTEKSSDRDKVAWSQNQAKWKAAAAFASAQGMIFRVITEQSMFAQGQTRKKK